MFNRWTFGKHVLACLGIWLFLNIVATFLPPPNKAASIGIIGGADGPTAIYIASKSLNIMLLNGALLLLLAAITLLLYKHIKKMLEREPKQN